jgi:acetyl esterase/lipase
VNRPAYLALFLLLSCLVSSAQETKKKKKKAAALPAGVEVLENIEFAKPAGHSLLLDLYRPVEFAAPVPTVVFVHGGGWKGGDKRSARKLAWLVPHGFAIASINYRLTDVAQWPSQINDCYAAVRWVREHAEKYGLDPAHIGCWGTSAGAHLAALMGTRRFPGKESASSQVQATCDWFGPTELLSMPPNNVGDVANSNGAKLLGATVRDVPKLAKDASGLDNVSKGDSPFLIMHGSADPGVPPEQSKALHARLKAVGVPTTLIILDGAGHGGSEFLRDSSQKAVVDFFRRYLK